MMHELPETDAKLAEFAAAHPAARLFVRGAADGRAILAAEPKRLHLVLEGEVSREDFLGVLIEARACDLPSSDDFHTLVDISRLTSALDWQAVAQVGEIMPKGDTATNKNAYVVRDSITAALTKVYSMLFAKTEHRAFTSADEAMRWLGWS